MELQNCESVQFRFDSSQRKNNVLIYDSKRFFNKSSEWYFVRKNQTTQNETYRCVHCRTTHEKIRRSLILNNLSTSKASSSGAQIIVFHNYFITNPDYPLSEHICNFEFNSNSDTHVVWSRRALLRANSELRFNPVRPKVKFQRLLYAIENGKNEYKHLSFKTRQMMIKELTSNNGFGSRRRSFARNNNFGLKKLQASLNFHKDDDMLKSLSINNKQNIQNQILSKKINNVESTKLDRQSKNKLIFFDNKDSIKINKKNPDFMETSGSNFNNEHNFDIVEYEVICESNDETNNIPEVQNTSSLILDTDIVDSAFLEHIDTLLNEIRKYAVTVSNNSFCRKNLLHGIQEIVNDCWENANFIIQNKTDNFLNSQNCQYPLQETSLIKKNFHNSTIYKNQEINIEHQQKNPQIIYI